MPRSEAFHAAVSAPRIAAESGAWQLFACLSRSILQQVTGTKACELQSMFITTGWRGEQAARVPSALLCQSTDASVALTGRAQWLWQQASH